VPQIQGQNPAAFSMDRTAATLTFTATRNAQGTFTVYLRARSRSSGNCWSQAVALTFTLYDVSSNVNNAGAAATLARGYWKGMKNDDWHDPCNWVDMVVPAANATLMSNPNHNVFVSGPTVFNGVPRPLHMPVVYCDDTPYGVATTQNLQIEPGASVTLNPTAPTTLMVKNSLWVRPQGTFYAGQGRITILENCLLDATGIATAARWFGAESQTRIAGHWERRSFAVYSAGVSSVEFFGDQTKNIVGAHTGNNKFFDLIVNKNDVNTLVVQTPGSTIEIGGQLRLRRGCLQNNVPTMTTQDECIVLNDDEDAIAEFGENAYVRGKLRRVILGGAAYPYHFPVGHQTTNVNYQLATVQFTPTNHGIASLVVYFNGRSPMEYMAVPEVPDQGVRMNTTVGGGFWTLTPSPVMTAGSYTLTLHKRGWTHTGTVYGVSKRANAAEAWDLPGIHVSTQVGPTLVCARTGYTNFSDAEIATGNVPLPVDGLTLSVRLETPNDATLTWTTVQETDNYGFEVQHAFATPTDFQAIAFVEGQNRPGAEYRYLHRDLSEGRHYYRLRQIDFDGRTTFSSVVEAVVTQNAASLTLYPNPSDGRATFSGAVAGQKAHLTVVNADGRALHDQTFVFQADGATFDFAQLPAGVYHFILHIQNANHAFKWVKAE
ncbi:MAG: T9SS type A sorting domain-containing protein, partial [Bacteroidia bacterium]|nr:T9SS type A sorting domain-containing protein [Bacteroidia bacterium]